VDRLQVPKARRKMMSIKVVSECGDYSTRPYGASPGIGKAPCWYCGEMTGNPTREHLVALASGGDDSPGNLVNACHPCNIAVGTWEIERKIFFRHLARLLGGEDARRRRGGVATLDLGKMPVQERVSVKVVKRILVKAAASAQRMRANELAQIQDLEGRKFGKMTVESYSHAAGKGPGGNKRKGGPRWLCRCECGALEIRTSGAIRHPDPNDMCGGCDRRNYEKRSAER
jgi:hypothetical protein